jgi:peroxiredoxin
MKLRRALATLTFLSLSGLFGGAFSLAADQVESKPPKIGDTIADFEFKTLENEKQTLAELTAKGPLVLVVLRGYPGYQCPVCTKQVADLRVKAKEFEELKANVLLVYPGSAEKLDERAKEFIKNSKLPKPLMLVTDPGYKFIEKLHLRWNAAGETAYPSTFILDRDRKVTYAKISKSHGDRAKTEAVLEVLRSK